MGDYRQEFTVAWLATIANQPGCHAGDGRT